MAVFFCLFFVTLWNDEVCDNGNGMKQYNFQKITVSLHRGRFVVVHLCSSFPIDPRIFPEGQISIKNYHFGRFGGRKATILKATVVKFGMSVRSWGCLPQAKYCENRLSWYTPLWQIYTKITIFCNFFGPLAKTVKFGVRVRTWETLLHPSSMPNFVKIGYGSLYTRLGQIYTKHYLNIHVIKVFSFFTVTGTARPTHPFAGGRNQAVPWCALMLYWQFIANLRYSTQCDDVTTVQYKSVLHGCIARMYPCAYGTITAEAENSPLYDQHSGSTQYGKPTLDLQVALSASPK